MSDAKVKVVLRHRTIGLRAGDVVEVDRVRAEQLLASGLAYLPKVAQKRG